MENPIKMDDLGVALFLETPIYFGNESNDILAAQSMSHGDSMMIV